MSRHLRFISALGAVFFAVGLTACGGIPGNAVVQVGGNPITKATFEHWMSVAAASTATTPGEKPVVPDPPKYTACVAHLEATAPKPAKGQSKPSAAQLKTQCEQQYKSLQQEVLGFLISSSWVLGEAESMGVKASDKEVKKQFEKIKNQQFPKAEEFKKFLASSGQTVSDLLLRVKLNLLSTKIQQKVAKQKPKVTQAQIEKYYDEHKSQFGAPEKRNLSIVLTKTEAAAKKAKQEVESGKSFASVAKSTSIDPTSKANGGELSGVVKGQEVKALDEAVFSAKQGVLSGPVKTPFGYYIFEVKGTTPGSQQTLAQAQSTIKQQLTTQQQQQALSKFVKEFRKKWTSKTECRAGYVVQNCKEYKVPKTRSTPIPITPQTSTPAQTTSTPAKTSTK
ncbi:MAG TPA: peptidyl-prolyl cis-trans isomerase [Solirubrobacteraceae bacterium]|nr:peptidyl-prolyl cis-trans isomerase [Solirubrobacteraceae bacterium]